VIGFTDILGKINVIVLKDGQVEIQETDLRRRGCCSD